jgi:hypothetical protein
MVGTMPLNIRLLLPFNLFFWESVLLNYLFHVPTQYFIEVYPLKSGGHTTFIGLLLHFSNFLSTIRYEVMLHANCK